jgi:hypothetical protein
MTHDLTTHDLAPPTVTECASVECAARMEEMNERIGELVEENGRLKRLEDVVKRNNALFEALVMNGNDGIALTGPDRRILKVVRGCRASIPVPCPVLSSTRWQFPKIAP